MPGAIAEDARAPRATPGAVAYMDVGEEREQDAEALPREGGVDKERIGEACTREADCCTAN